MGYEEYIGKNIKDVRTQRGLSQQALADKCGFSNTILSQYENGKKTPNLVTTAKIAKALNVSIERLYYGDENSAFINSESDEGRKIVNAIYYLWNEGIIDYFENFTMGYPPRRMEQNFKIEDIERLGVYLFLKKHDKPIKRLINSLKEFSARKGTYDDPQAYLEILFSSVASEINYEIMERKMKEQRMSTR